MNAAVRDPIGQALDALRSELDRQRDALLAQRADEATECAEKLVRVLTALRAVPAHRFAPETRSELRDLQARARINADLLARSQAPNQRALEVLFERPPTYQPGVSLFGTPSRPIDAA